VFENTYFTFFSDFKNSTCYDSEMACQKGSVQENVCNNSKNVKSHVFMFFDVDKR